LNENPRGGGFENQEGKSHPIFSPHGLFFLDFF